MRILPAILLAAAAAFVLSGCGSDEEPTPRDPDGYPDKNPFPSTYSASQETDFVIRNVNVLTGTGERLDNVDVLVSGGKFSAVGGRLRVPRGTREIDGSRHWLTPGLIDVHTHMGVYPAPSTSNHSDGNEMSNPVTAEVWAEHSVWPQDPAFEKAIAGGVTTLQVLPGSANLIGGRGVTLKNVASTTVQGMKFPGAPYSLKMACGENPKRVYGNRKQAPSTRMGNIAGYRAAWIKAQKYSDDWEAYLKKHAAGEKAEKPKRDLQLETLKGVLDGEIRIHNHCYMADEMAQMIDMSKEFGYEIAAFHHAIEAYKVAPLLAENNICAVVWADWWGFKQEAFDMVRENAAMVDYARACAIIHSDSSIQVQRLNQEVAKAMSAGNRMGLDISPAQAIRWLTINPAKSLGLEDKIGSIEAGKNADLVLWDGPPLSVFSHASKVWIDGVLRFDRNNPEVRPTSDFNIGILVPGENRP